MVARWPSCDEGGLVFGLVRALLDLVAGEPSLDDPLGQVIQRCLAPEPARRIATCQELRDALRLAGGHRVARPASRPPRTTWQLLEEGIGYLAVGQPTPALRLFDAAVALDPRSEPAGALVLGHLLVFGARFAEALDAFDAAARCGAGHAAELGRGHALLELERPELALAAFDDVLRDHRDLGDAREGRALALKRLGRDAEAEAAFRLHIEIVARSAERRVRSAEQ